MAEYILSSLTDIGGPCRLHEAGFSSGCSPARVNCASRIPAAQRGPMGGPRATCALRGRPHGPYGAPRGPMRIWGEGIFAHAGDIFAHPATFLRIRRHFCAYGGGNAHGWSEMWAPGPQVGVLGFVRSSQGRFYPPKNGPRMVGDAHGWSEMRMDGRRCACMVGCMDGRKCA